MENESKKYPGFKEIPFDLSILTHKELHDGFFAVVFPPNGKAQSHWDKMDGSKFGTVVESIIGVALSHDIRNLDLLISFLQDYKARIKEDIIQNAEIVVEEKEKEKQEP